MHTEDPPQWMAPEKGRKRLHCYPSQLILVGHLPYPSCSSTDPFECCTQSVQSESIVTFSVFLADMKNMSLNVNDQCWAGRPGYCPALQKVKRCHFLGDYTCDKCQSLHGGIIR